jgi:hypothetical protein
MDFAFKLALQLIFVGSQQITTAFVIAGDAAIFGLARLELGIAAKNGIVRVHHAPFQHLGFVRLQAAFGSSKQRQGNRGVANVGIGQMVAHDNGG